MLSLLASSQFCACNLISELSSMGSSNRRLVLGIEDSLRLSLRRVYQYEKRGTRHKFFDRSRENLRNPSIFTYVIILVGYR